MRVEAVDRRAELAGLCPGQTLADARALAPRLQADPADPAGDLAALAALARWALRYTPWTAMDGLEDGGAGGLWLDITGCAHLFAPRHDQKEEAGETALLDDLLRRLAAAGFTAQAGLADTPGAAWAAARFAASSSAQHIIAPDRQRAALTGLPIAALRLPAETLAGLERLGLRRIGEVLALPRTGLAQRFGPLLPRRLDQALGQIAEPISPQPPPPSWRVALAPVEPLGRPEDIAEAVRQLLDTLCGQLAAAGRGARTLELALYRSGGRVDTLPVGTSRASRDPDHLMRLFGDRLERLAAPLPAFPDPAGVDTEQFVDFLTLTATRSELLAAAQIAAPAVPIGDDKAEDDEVAPLVDRLAARLGDANVVRFVPVASHLPERAQLPQPALAGGKRAAAFPQFHPPHQPPRPPRLLAQPEPVDAIAPVPDDPPLLFRWRGRTHRIARAEGPERIASEWWRPPARLGPATRDYYRVEDSDGRRYWLYRAGLYGTDEAETPRWFLHGLFG